jgi:hypothetical protein
MPRYNRADLDLDDACRVCELEVLAAVGKDRAHADYRATFPKGLSALVADRGRSQAAKVKALAGELTKRMPDLAGRHAAKLEALAAGMVDADDKLRAAQLATSSARNDERIARSELIRQLHRNRGALRAVYPRNIRRVRGFFPPSYSRAAGETPEEETAEEAEGDETPAN